MLGRRKETKSLYICQSEHQTQAAPLFLGQLNNILHPDYRWLKKDLECWDIDGHILGWCIRMSEVKEQEEPAGRQRGEREKEG